MVTCGLERQNQHSSAGDLPCNEFSLLTTLAWKLREGKKLTLYRLDQTGSSIDSFGISFSLVRTFLNPMSFLITDITSIMLRPSLSQIEGSQAMISLRGNQIKEQRKETYGGPFAPPAFFPFFLSLPPKIKFGIPYSFTPESIPAAARLVPRDPPAPATNGEAVAFAGGAA